MSSFIKATVKSKRYKKDLRRSVSLSQNRERFTNCSCLCSEKNNGLENRPPSANSQLYLRHPAKPLAARRSNVPPATSYTFAIFSPSTSIYLCRPLRGGLPSTCFHALPQDHRQADGFPDGVRARRKHAAVRSRSAKPPPFKLNAPCSAFHKMWSSTWKPCDLSTNR